MKILYDELADGLVIEFSDRKPSKSHTVDESVMIYTDDDGHVIQISIRPASAHIENPFEITTEFASKAVSTARLQAAQPSKEA